MAMNSPHNGSSWGWCERKRRCGGGRCRGTGRGASRCYVTLKTGQPSASRPTCGICISIDLCSVCGSAVYQKFLPLYLCMNVYVTFCLCIEALFSLFIPQVLRTHVMVRVGGGWDTLEHYLDKHDPCRCAAFGEVTSCSLSAPYKTTYLLCLGVA